MFKRLKRPLRHLITLALLAWVVQRIASRGDIGALTVALHSADSAWLVAAALLSTLAVVLSVLRFRVLLCAAGLDLGLGWLARITLEGRFVGAFTPSTAGLDVYRAVAVGRRTQAKSVAASVVMIEKMVGLLALASLAGILLLLGADILDGRGLVLSAALWLGCAAVLLLVSRPPALRRAKALLPKVARRRLSPLLKAFEERRPSASALATAFVLSLGSHLLTASVFLATSKSLGLTLSPVTLLSLGVALVLSALLPISVGGIGLREGVAVMLLAGLGVAAPQAALVATLGWLLTQPPALVGGLLSLAPRERVAAEIAPHTALAYVSSAGSLVAPPR